MRLLLDTQVWLWMVAAPDRLSEAGRAMVIAPSNELLLSAASAWEVAIKLGLGKLQLPEAPDAYIPRLMARAGIAPLPILHRHALHVVTLPPHHRDPFDRLLVAQAQIEKVPILTADETFQLYDVEVVIA
jgi:PIN domain nuclease of toxin-antitoxin system